MTEKQQPGTLPWVQFREVESLASQGLAFVVIHTVLDVPPCRSVP
jgi:hypothetical protein